MDDDTEDDSRRLQPHRTPNQSYNSSFWPTHAPKLSSRAPPSNPLLRDRFTGAELDDYENTVQEDDDPDDYEESNGYNEEEKDSYLETADSEESSEKYRKKRKLETFDVVRLVNPSAEWSEEETFLLVETWGERFVQCGRRSLRTEEWKEVAERVSEVVKHARSDSQCRSRFDSLKRRYRKEKDKLNNGSSSSKWVYFKKMDMLMMGWRKREESNGLGCGVDAGEYVFMDPHVYLRRSNGLDEMRDSPESSDLSGGFGDGSDGAPPPGPKGGCGDSSSMRLLADSIHRFGEIYEKIEEGKRRQMMELEKMRIDFQHEIERERRQMLEKAQAEIVKLRQEDDDDYDDDGDDDDTDVSFGNRSE